MRVVVLPEVQMYLQEVMQILFDQNYFGFMESAMTYIDELRDDINDTIAIRQHKTAPSYFDRYGKNMFYAVFKKNKSTQWYIFFNIYGSGDNTVYLVRYISNNHVIAKFLE